MKAMRRVAIAILILAASAVLPSKPSSAYQLSLSGGLYGGVIYYSIDANTIPSSFNGRIVDADQEWNLPDIGDTIQYNNNPYHYVYEHTTDGAGDHTTLAFSTEPCYPSNSCFMDIDPAENWYTGTGSPGSQIDLWGVVTHEFGHWQGLGHSHDKPSTDYVLPTMWQYYYDQTTKTEWRTIQQDDANGVLDSIVNDPIANDSFEYTTPYYGWGFLASANGGAMARYYDPSHAHSGNYFVQFNGNGLGGSSVIQAVGVNTPHSRSYRAGSWVRNDTGSTITATVVLWYSSTGNQLANCSLAPNVWTFCRAPTVTVSAGGTWLTYQVINYGSGNMSMDDMTMYPF